MPIFGRRGKYQGDLKNDFLNSSNIQTLKSNAGNLYDQLSALDVRRNHQIAADISSKAATEFRSVMSTMEKLYDSIDSLDKEMQMQTESVEFEDNENFLMEMDYTKMAAAHVRRNYKKGDQISYVDARDQETYTHTFKGLMSKGGRPYAKVETGKEMVLLPMHQLVIDVDLPM